MRPISFILITAALWFGYLHNAFAGEDEDDEDYKPQHRISILPSQIALGEYSIYYEYRAAQRYAFEVSAGFQTLYPEWHPSMTLLLDYDFEGVVLRATMKAFLAKKYNNWYLAPMGLFKGIASNYTKPSEWMPDWETRYQISRTVLGFYGLIGYRTTGKVYVETYAGWGLRIIHDDVQKATFRNGDLQYTSSYGEGVPLPDMKFGIKVGICIP